MRCPVFPRRDLPRRLPLLLGPSPAWRGLIPETALLRAPRLHSTYWRRGRVADRPQAQQPGIPVIGFLSSRAPGEAPQLLATSRQGATFMAVLDKLGLSLFVILSERPFDE
jgi:hypothetical protein